MTPFKFAQISDLHFGSIVLNPLQLFSKQWVGNLNYILNRKKSFHYDQLYQLPQLLKEQGVTHLFITGDLTVTAQKKEYKRALAFVEEFKKRGIEVFAIPGNHDHYTKNQFKKGKFYRFFEKQFDMQCPFNLAEHGVTYTQLQPGLWLLALDTTCAAKMFAANGHFTPEIEKNLQTALQSIPQEDRIILINHYPFFEQSNPKNQLIGGSRLKELLSKHPHVLLYLHGHTHRNIIADLRPSELPILADTGSTAHRNHASFHLYELDKNQLELTRFGFDETWKEGERHAFQL